MKKMIFLFACMCMNMFQAISQPVRVTNTTRVMSMSPNPNNALVVQIVGTDPDEVMKDFVSYWKDLDARPDYKDEEMKAVNYEVKDLKPSIYSLYAKAEKENKTESILYFWVFNGSEFIGPSDPAYKYFEEKLRAFAVAETRKPIEKELKEATKALEKISNDKQSLEKDRAGWQKDIDDCNEAIKRNQDKLKDSEPNLGDLGQKVKQQEEETNKLKQRIESIQ